MKAAQASALLHDERFVTPQRVQELVVPVLAHRMLLRSNSDRTMRSCCRRSSMPRRFPRCRGERRRSRIASLSSNWPSRADEARGPAIQPAAAGIRCLAAALVQSAPGHLAAVAGLFYRGMESGSGAALRSLGAGPVTAVDLAPDAETAAARHRRGTLAPGRPHRRERGRTGLSNHYPRPALPSSVEGSAALCRSGADAVCLALRQGG
ncbi:MAG: hypothetical protein AB2820_04100 [Candidatus Thiodiazotropha sp.]